MSTNKNALIRYKVLDKCFRNPGKRYFINDLILECEKVLLDIDSDSNGISRRQIFDDISFMESKEGWEIELNKNRDGKRVYYRYVNTSFSINNMPLNEVEVNQLKDALVILSQFKGMPQFEWVHELVPKLMVGLSDNQVPSTIIEFDNNQYLKGIEHLGPLYNAIFYKKVLEVCYHPFENEDAYNILIHPYFIKQYNSRWFLFGFNHENGKYDWNLALDRIVSIKEINMKYHENSIIDWHEYFEDIIGVTKPVNAEIENVVLHFNRKTGNYIETKPLHGSQKSEWLDLHTFKVRLQLIINYELERLILSYAESVIVVKPESLVYLIKERLKSGLNQY